MFSLVLIVLGCLCQISIAASQLPAFSFSDLVTPSDSVLTQLTTALTEVGALQITGIPNFREARLAALQPLAKCLLNEQDAKITKMVMSDGSPRLTTHASTIAGSATSFSSTCGDSSTNLRAVIDVGTRQLLITLDKARKSREKTISKSSSSTAGQQVLAPYTSFESLQLNGDHLEHLHAYYPAPSEQPRSGDGSTIRYHTDGGLFIAMTSGLHSSTANTAISSSSLESPNAGLFLQLADGGELKVASGDIEDGMVFMVGEAGSKWLAPTLGKPLRAVPHRLVVDIQSQATTQQNNVMKAASFKATDGGHIVSRAWYGKMYLPPADAMVAGTTYSRYREAVGRRLGSKPAAAKSVAIKMPFASSLSSSWLQGGDELPLACDSGMMLEASVACTAKDGSPGVECWMQCMSTASLPCGTSAVCYDSSTDTVNNGDTMCQATCSLQCPNTYVSSLSNVSATPIISNGYCYGTGTTMIMEGFTSQLASGVQAPCLNFLFPAWPLNTPLRFTFGCIGTVLLGIFLHFVTKIRLTVARWKLSAKRTSTICCLYLANAILGYALMLVAMSYSTELFLMVILGLLIGYILFLVDLPAAVSTDPCCQDEEKDIAGKANGSRVGGLGALLLAPSSHSLLVNSSE